MNAQRRKLIEVIESTLDLIKDQVGDLQSEESDSYDNLPESQMYGDKGSEMEEAQDSLESAADSVQEAIDYLTAAREVTHG